MKLQIVFKTILSDRVDDAFITKLVSDPNLDDGFRIKMINNFESIRDTIGNISLITGLDSKKICEYIDTKYVSAADISFFDHFSNRSSN